MTHTWKLAALLVALGIGVTVPIADPPQAQAAPFDYDDWYYDDGYYDDDWYYDYYDGDWYDRGEWFDDGYYGGDWRAGDTFNEGGRTFGQGMESFNEGGRTFGRYGDTFNDPELGHYGVFGGYDDAGELGLFDW